MSERTPEEHRGRDGDTHCTGDVGAEFVDSPHGDGDAEDEQHESDAGGERDIAGEKIDGDQEAEDRDSVDGIWGPVTDAGEGEGGHCDVAREDGVWGRCEIVFDEREEAAFVEDGEAVEGVFEIGDIIVGGRAEELAVAKGEAEDDGGETRGDQETEEKPQEKAPPLVGTHRDPVVFDVILDWDDNRFGGWVVVGTPPE